MKDFWESRDAEDQYAHGINPNEFLEGYLESKKPRKILLQAEGEVRNAIYAAKLGS